MKRSCVIWGRRFESIFTYLLAAPHHLMSWLVKADKPFTVRVSASPPASRKENIRGETGASDKTLSKHPAELPRLVCVKQGN
ncbi:hypothetical protein IWW34DRAFT_237786 [Fusarium oxysporum f. sp. albedinis]|nr:hypothetical protein IWW34DRAFT_237786 [Fusarium oxysporum f. sp. albedinis]